MRLTTGSWRARWRPWLWFAGLYLAALAIYAAVTLLLRLIMTR